MPLEYLDLSWIGATDASPLQGVPLRTLHWPGIPMRNLAQLRGLPLETLSVFRSGSLESLDGIQGSPLQVLSAYDSRLTDISALKGLSIVEADLGGNSISDFTALSGCQKLERLLISPKSSDIAHLQKLPKLGRIGFGNLGAYANSWNTVPTAAEFWKKNGERLKRQVPQEKQLEKFHQSLIAQGNDPDKLPRFAFSMDGKLVIKLQPPAVGKCTDISGLRGVAVNEFYSDRQISDIAPLAGAPLEYLFVSSPSISDLSPLRGAPLKTLHIPGTAVSDLSPLRGAPLERLWITRTRVTDMSVLLNFPLLKEVLLPSGANNIEVLKKHANLSRISFNGGGPGGTIPAQTAAEFWKEFDTKKTAEAK
jgi:Leucine-rich repeat (LRR) protein